MNEPNDSAVPDGASIAKEPLERFADGISGPAANPRDAAAVWQASGAPGACAIHFDEAVAYIGRLTLILYDLAAEPGAADARRALTELHREVHDALEASQRHGVR